MDVLNKIRLLMNKKGWSEYHLSRVSGVPQSTINSMFRNSNLPTITTLESICKAFDISLSEFFGRLREILQINLSDITIIDIIPLP